MAPVHKLDDKNSEPRLRFYIKQLTLDCNLNKKDLNLMFICDIFNTQKANMILELIHIQNLNLFLKKILNKDPYVFYKNIKINILKWSLK